MVREPRGASPVDNPPQRVQVRLVQGPQTADVQADAVHRHGPPFQDRANHLFNSTLLYEPAVLKVFAERFLMEVPDSDPTFVEASRLMEFLDLFVPVFADDVPATSILREFLGGSAFNY